MLFWIYFAEILSSKFAPLYIRTHTLYIYIHILLSNSLNNYNFFSWWIDEKTLHLYLASQFIRKLIFAFKCSIVFLPTSKNIFLNFFPSITHDSIFIYPLINILSSRIFLQCDDGVCHFNALICRKCIFLFMTN